MKSRLFLFILFIFFYFLLSYRLLDVPMGFTVDESAFGYNAALLARTGYDENGVKLPVFVHSINKSDWRQPWSQYYITLFFKIFGISIYNLRLSSVVLILISAVFLYRFCKKLLSSSASIFALILFIFTPIIFMHAHLGLDNIMVLPFTILWISFIYQFQTTKNKKYLFISGLILGLSFYTYKGMRAVVPVWSFLTIIYLIIIEKKIFLPVPFIIGLIPSVILIPIFSFYYHGAIFGGSRPKFDGIYNLFYPYLSHFDPTFLFIKGDDLLFHSTRIHGMFLLSSLPLFIFGIYHIVKKQSSIWNFIILAFVTAPLLFGLVESTHRASRIICFVPFFIMISAFGFQNLKIIYLKVLISILILVNFVDFIKYYWFTYPKFTDQLFGNMDRNQSYQEFSRASNTFKLTPYVDRDIFEGFYAAVYFNNLPKILDSQSLPPSNSIYMTSKGNLTGYELLTETKSKFYIYKIQ